ncbi:MAG: MBL fold metallo-hydrolase [Candidatus Methylomirabilis sp.]
MNCPTAAVSRRSSRLSRIERDERCPRRALRRRTRRPIAAFVVTLPISALLVALLGAGCAGVGGPPPDAPPHHRIGGFANTNPEFARPNRWVRTAFTFSRIWSTTFHPKVANLPRATTDGKVLREHHNEPTVIWVGHSTLLVQLDGINLLTDPHWSDRASPVSFAGPRRITPPGLRFEDLPPIHLVLISHDHFDHLDAPTVSRLARMHRPLFVVPLGLKAWFAERGITDVEELDWWQSRSVRGLSVTCLPAQHFSGRTLWDQNRRLWSSWAVAGQAKRFFFAGDTGYTAGFKEIGARLGPFDLVAIPIGAYLPPRIMKMVHTTPEEALQLFLDVRGARFVGLHWGTFDMADEPSEEPPQRLEGEARRLGLGPEQVWVLKPGEARRW